MILFAFFYLYIASTFFYLFATRGKGPSSVYTDAMGSLLWPLALTVAAITDALGYDFTDYA